MKTIENHERGQVRCVCNGNVFSAMYFGENARDCRETERTDYDIDASRLRLVERKTARAQRVLVSNVYRVMSGSIRISFLEHFYRLGEIWTMLTRSMYSYRISGLSINYLILIHRRLEPQVHSGGRKVDVKKFLFYFYMYRFM